MTTAAQGRAQNRRSRPSRQRGRQHEQHQHPHRRDGTEHQNVSQGERAASTAAGSILAILGLSRRSIPGLLMAGLGGAMIRRGVTGHCNMYESLGIDTAHEDGESIERRTAERGIHVEQAFLINRSPEDLYKFWRNFQNLPSIMSYLQEVNVLDEKRSRWVACAPRLAGGTVEWDAEITADEPNRRIAWHSLPGSEIDTVGEITFNRAMGDRGTEVHVSMNYLPPAGRLGHWAATLFGQSPWRQMREDLRNFKRIMEVGEVLTIKGQPRGSCTGVGSRREK